MLLLELYPQDQKVPDALFKLGKLHFEKGERDKAREFLERVVSQHASSGSGAVNLARDFLRNNY
jgi:TolA-binding protein